MVKRPKTGFQNGQKPVYGNFVYIVEIPFYIHQMLFFKPTVHNSLELLFAVGQYIYGLNF